MSARSKAISRRTPPVQHMVVHDPLTLQANEEQHGQNGNRIRARSGAG
jgi:hypothetical protein